MAREPLLSRLQEEGLEQMNDGSPEFLRLRSRLRSAEWVYRLRLPVRGDGRSRLDRLTDARDRRETAWDALFAWSDERWGGGGNHG